MGGGLIYGVGINDSTYPTQVSESKRLERSRWICPYYARWKDMLRRCYSESFQKTSLTYRGCSVDTSWHSFMNFRGWMIEQDWKGKVLDKDILFQGNKIYSSDTCVFVSNGVNVFLSDSRAIRGKWPIGVHLHKQNGKFRAQCGQLDGSHKHLGMFDTPEEAHEAWRKEKLSQAKLLASMQMDKRVARALIERYENYKGV